MAFGSKMTYLLLTSTIFSFTIFTSLFTKYSEVNIIMPNSTSTLSIKRDCSEFSKGTLEETSSQIESRDECWWLDSGALFNVTTVSAGTITGELPVNSYWRKVYNLNNPIDTDFGLHPQNIFRLINKSKWQNSIQSISFKIDRYNLSGSPNRNMSNGVLLMSHYLDSNNLYYAGLRVDGTAVIKKKINGYYITLGSNKYDTLNTYNESTNPILLPTGRWIGEKFITQTDGNNSVRLKFFADVSGNGDWKLLLDVRDSETSSGAPPITREGNVGIRSDFMDIEFNNYKIEKI
jgi:hypothetical protein